MCKGYHTLIFRVSHKISKNVEKRHSWNFLRKDSNQSPTPNLYFLIRLIIKISDTRPYLSGNLNNYKKYTLYK